MRQATQDLLDPAAELRVFTINRIVARSDPMPSPHDDAHELQGPSALPHGGGWPGLQAALARLRRGLSW